MKMDNKNKEEEIKQKDYLEMVGLENYIQLLDYNDSKKSDFLAGDTNARRENYYELQHVGNLNHSSRLNPSLSCQNQQSH